MENENNEALNGEEIPENGFEKEDIPLWLQGIEESKDEGSISSEEENDAPDQWVKENPEETGDKFDAVDLSEEIIQNGEELPVWIEEVPGVPTEVSSDSETAGIHENGLDISTLDQEELTPNDIELPQDETYEPMSVGDQEEKTQDPADPEPNEEDYFEISEAEFQDESPTNKEVDSTNNEALPYWLQEMIAEPAENELDDQGPEVVSNEDSLDEELEDAPIDDEIIETGSPNDQKHGLEEPQLPDAEALEHPAADLIAEDNTKPVIVQIKEEDSPDTLDVVEDSELEDKKGFPDDLNNARLLLTEGKHSEAIEAINSCDEKSLYSDDIRSWLLSAADSSPGGKSEVWEALGDLALSDENPEEALDAYTKALQSLMTDRKAFDGAD